jgi:hypothetical protein
MLTCCARCNCTASEQNSSFSYLCLWILLSSEMERRVECKCTDLNRSTFQRNLLPWRSMYLLWSSMQFMAITKRRISKSIFLNVYLQYLYITPFKVIYIENYPPLQLRFPGFEAFPEVVLWTLKVTQPSSAYTLCNKLGVRWQFCPVLPQMLYSHFVQFLTKRDGGRLFSNCGKLFLDTTSA